MRVSTCAENMLNHRVGNPCIFPCLGISLSATVIQSSLIRSVVSQGWIERSRESRLCWDVALQERQARNWLAALVRAIASITRTSLDWLACTAEGVDAWNHNTRRKLHDSGRDDVNDRPLVLVRGIGCASFMWICQSWIAEWTFQFHRVMLNASYQVIPFCCCLSTAC